MLPAARSAWSSPNTLLWWRDICPLSSRRSVAQARQNLGMEKPGTVQTALWLACLGVNSGQTSFCMVCWQQFTVHAQSWIELNRRTRTRARTPPPSHYDVISLPSAQRLATYLDLLIVLDPRSFLHSTLVVEDSGGRAMIVSLARPSRYERGSGQTHIRLCGFGTGALRVWLARLGLTYVAAGFIRASESSRHMVRVSSIITQNYSSDHRSQLVWHVNIYTSNTSDHFPFLFLSVYSNRCN